MRAFKKRVNNQVFIDLLTRPDTFMRPQIMTTDSAFTDVICNVRCLLLRTEKILISMSLMRTLSCQIKFKKTFFKFEDIDAKDSFFGGAVLLGLLTKLSSANKNFTVECTTKKLGKEFPEKLFSGKENLHLDYSFEYFFGKCHLVNKLLEEKHLFLRVYERRDKFRFLIKKGLSGKNRILPDLFGCIIRKFDSYEISSGKFKREQK